jgi:hypothetical protein
MDPFAHLNELDKSALREFLSKFGNKKWFAQSSTGPTVNIVYNHPETLSKTLQVYCNNQPVYEMQDLIAFCNRHSLVLKIIDLSHR